MIITEFQGEYRWLSNFWEVPFIHDGIEYKSNEHFYQAQKFPVSEHLRISRCEKPKAEGRKAKLGREWNLMKFGIMNTGLIKKFEDPIMRAKLLATGTSEIIEGNYWHDNFWGDCSCDKCKDIQGLNILGKLLMNLREDIHHESTRLPENTYT